MDTDVLIVGAGPTGLMLANQLARRGVRVMVIDRNAGPSRETRALGVHARSLEIYQRLGLAAEALALGKRSDGANLWAAGMHKGRVPLGDAGRELSPYPYILVLGQDENERLLGKRLNEFGVDVHWQAELLGLAQDAEQATAVLRFADGSVRRVEARFVAGCDGAHSTVRKLCDIEFPGAPYEQVFFVADMRMRGPMVPDEVNVYLWRSGFHLFFPMRGEDHWRIVGIVPKHLRDRGELSFDDVKESLTAEAGEAMRFDECSWFSTYRIHHRRAAQFRHGRCFLLGDAAHIHSPMGAQGMNTGLQDAYNLGWKLAEVLRGDAHESLLDSYESERIPVAKRLLSGTDRLFRMIVADNWLAGLWRTKVLARVAGFVLRRPLIQAWMFRSVSQVGIGYADSALSQANDWLPPEAPQPGDRFPWLRLRLRADGPVHDLYQVLDDRRFHLFVVGQSLPEGMQPLPGARVCTHLIPRGVYNDDVLRRRGFNLPCYYLVRPDGHVALAGTRLRAESVRDWFRDQLGSELETIEEIFEDVQDAREALLPA
jgi:2-polyprenyl-6-methoxyphenol hydroxylase-like FAD-dependent oxidoreductase